MLWDPLLAANPLRVLLLGRSSPVPLASHKCPVLIAHVRGGSPSPPAPFPLCCSLASPCIPFDFQLRTHICFLEDRDWHRGKNNISSAQSYSPIASQANTSTVSKAIDVTYTQTKENQSAEESCVVICYAFQISQINNANELIARLV